MITINNSGKNNLTEKMTEAKNAFIDQLAESYTEFNRTYSREIPTEFFDRCVEKYGIDFVLKTYDERYSFRSLYSPEEGWEFSPEGL